VLCLERAVLHLMLRHLLLLHLVLLEMEAGRVIAAMEQRLVWVLVMRLTRRRQCRTTDIATSNSSSSSSSNIYLHHAQNHSRVSRRCSSGASA
jgi:hypothetical protein